MYKQSLNRAVLQVRVETVTPLLIKAGDSGLDPTAANLACVRTRHAIRGPTVYIPGSSLKGVIRSAAEAAVRGRKIRGSDGACNPVGDSKCHDKRRADETTPHAHRRQCLACRAFGSQLVKGRISVRDLFPWLDGDAPSEDAIAANRVEVRHGVAIDRVTGSVSVGPFDHELVPAGVSFWGEVSLENFQVWQLGLLLQGLDDITAGFAQLGSSKSRGLGVARVTVTEILHEQPAHRGERPRGVGDLVDATALADYGLFPETPLPLTPGERRGLHTRFLASTPAAVDSWAVAARTALEALA